MYPLDAFVVIHGLIYAGETMNGLVGRVTDVGPPGPSTRYQLRLARGDTVMIREENLRHLPRGPCVEQDSRYYSSLPLLTLDIVQHLIDGQTSAALDGLELPNAFDVPTRQLPLDALNSCFDRYLTSHSTLKHSCRVIEASADEHPRVFADMTAVIGPWFESADVRECSMCMRLLSTHLATNTAIPAYTPHCTPRWAHLHSAQFVACGFP